MYVLAHIFFFYVKRLEDSFTVIRRYINTLLLFIIMNEMWLLRIPYPFKRPFSAITGDGVQRGVKCKDVRALTSIVCIQDFDEFSFILAFYLIRLVFRDIYTLVRNICEGEGDLWCDQAKWVGTRWYWFLDTACYRITLYDYITKWTWM